MDEQKIDPLTLEQMIRFLPTKEEEELLRNCPSEELAYLDKPEQYALEVGFFTFNFVYLMLCFRLSLFPRSLQN